MSTVIIAAWRKSMSRCNKPTGSCSQLITSLLNAIITRYDLSYQQNGRQPLSGKGKKKRGVEGAIETKSADGLHLDSRDIFFPTPFPFEATVTVPVSMLGYGGGTSLPSLPLPGHEARDERREERAQKADDKTTPIDGSGDVWSTWALLTMRDEPFNRACLSGGCERSHGEGGWRSSNNCTLALLRGAPYKPLANVAGFCGSCVDARSSTC